jgi:hypothetical protein
MNEEQQETVTTATLKWGIAAALLVTFLFGGLVGALVERERVLSEGSERGAASAQTSEDVASAQTPADWFDGTDTTVCVPLRRWQASVSAADVALLAGATDWDASRATLLQQNAEGTAALRSLLPFVSPTGTAEIQWLIAYYGDARTALKGASSEAEYLASLEARKYERKTRNVGILTQAVAFCPAT